MTRLLVHDVRKSYGDHRALDGVSLEVAEGEMVALLGRNGAGKSTLVTIVAGRRTPDEGQVLIDGVGVGQDPARVQRWIGYAPQETGVYEPLTGIENLRFFGELAGLRGATLRRRIAEVVDLFDLGGFVERSVRALSGGERRRVHTAAALLHRPRVLLLDEPTVGADIEAREAILGAVASLAETGASIIYTTHYLTEVEKLGARVVILDHGRVLAHGEQRELIRRHGRPLVELVFRGPAPEVRTRRAEVERRGSVLRIHGADAAALAAKVLARMGPDAARLETMDAIRADLEAVFVALTGERFGADSPTGEPVAP